MHDPFPCMLTVHSVIYSIYRYGLFCSNNPQVLRTIDPCMDIPIWLELFLLATTQNKQYILTSQHQYMDFSCSWKTIPSFRRHNLPSYYTTGELGSSRQALVLSLRAGSHEPCSLTSPTQAPISSASFIAPTAVLDSDSCTFLVFPLSEPPAAKVGTVSKQEYTIKYPLTLVLLRNRNCVGTLPLVNSFRLPLNHLWVLIYARIF